jgi:hypothetical protein
VKTVTLQLPWSAVLTLRKIALDDGAFLTPVCREKRFIAYGDSITHGYDATRPHLRQIARLADALGASEANKTEVYVCFLRRKLRRIDANAEIFTVRGEGYRLEMN